MSSLFFKSSKLLFWKRHRILKCVHDRRISKDRMIFETEKPGKRQKGKQHEGTNERATEEIRVS